MTSQPHRFNHLRLEDLARHGVCGQAGCRSCDAVGAPGARQLIESRAARRQERKARARALRRLVHGPAHTPEQVWAHDGCGELDCPLCRARTDTGVMAELEAWARKRRWREDSCGGGCGSDGSCACSSAGSGSSCGCTTPGTMKPGAGVLAAGRAPEAPGRVNRSRSVDTVPSAATAFRNTLMPERVRSAPDGPLSSTRGRFGDAPWSSAAPDPFETGCSLCPHPEEADGERESLVQEAGTCSSCNPGLRDTFTDTLYVSPSGSGSGTSPSSPMSFEAARQILGSGEPLGGLTVLFDVSEPFEVGDPTDSADLGGHVIDPLGPCWEPWTLPDGRPRAFLVIRSSGLPGNPLRLGSYSPSSTAPAMAPAPPADDPLGDDIEPTRWPTGPERAVFDGGMWCYDAPPTDSDDNVLSEIPDYATHTVHAGIQLENACHIEIVDLEITGFRSGIRAYGHCWDVVCSDLHLRKNTHNGIQTRACPTLWEDDDSCTDGSEGPDFTIEDADGQTLPQTAPAWLLEAQGYCSDWEITHCNFEDNGWGGNSAFAQLNPAEYSTNFHIHDNLFCMTAFGCAWEHFPPAPTIFLAADKLPSADLSTLAPECYDDVDDEGELTGCSCDEAAQAVQQMTDACCGASFDPETQTPCQDQEDDAGDAIEHCSCGTSEDCKEAAVAAKLARGFRLEPLAEGLCERPSGDGITFLRSSTGHVVENNTFIGMNQNCGSFPRAEVGCTDLSDGDGIDMKGVRLRTPNADSELTVIRHNLFLFCEGAGVQMINGTQGVEIYRNVFAGGGIGVKLDTGDNTHFYGEWTCEDTDGEETLDWYETGCVRIYRNLFYRQDRLDKQCSGQGTGGGAAVLIDATNPLGFVDAREGADDDGYVVDTVRPTRIRDVWVGNNTIDSNPGGGIVISRALDCLVDWDKQADLPRATADDCADTDEYKAALLRVTGVHVLNNLVTNNNTWGSSNTCMQAIIGSAHVQWVGQVGQFADGRTYDPASDEVRSFAEEIEVDANIWWKPEGDGRNSKAMRYSYLQPRWDELVNTFGQETFWEDVAGFDPDLGASSPDANLWHEYWDNITNGAPGYLQSVAPTWSWQDGGTLGYDFEPDWGVVEAAWDTLDSAWNPRSFRPTPGSLATVGVVASGIYDHGVWSEKCNLADKSAPSLVDVAEAPDLLCTRGEPSPYIGALNILEEVEEDTSYFTGPGGWAFGRRVELRR